MSAPRDREQCPACGAALEALRERTDAERAHEVAEDLRARGADLTDVEVAAQLDAASRAF